MSVKTDISKTFSGLRDAIGRVRLSVVEIVFLGAALLYAGTVTIYYFYKVQPRGDELAAKEQQIKDFKASIQKSNTAEEKRVLQASNSEKILESLRSFESNLKPDQRGMTQIINEVDALGKTHQVITGDSAFRVEDADEPQLDENGNPKPQPNKDKRPKIYPNLGIDTVVIGDYPNLRRFIADLERSKQFVIINGLGFQGGDDKLIRQVAKGGKQLQLSQDAIPVSLKIELDTYFQPPSIASGSSIASTASGAAVAPAASVTTVKPAAPAEKKAQ